MSKINNVSVDDNNEDDSWIPLDNDAAAAAENANNTHCQLNNNDNIKTYPFSGNHRSNIHGVTSMLDSTYLEKSNNNNDTRNNRRRNHYDSQEGIDSNKMTIEMIRARHERNLHLKQNFVNLPLLLFPKILLFHLVTEFWNSHISIRIGKFVFKVLQRFQCKLVVYK